MYVGGNYENPNCGGNFTQSSLPDTTEQAKNVCYEIHLS